MWEIIQQAPEKRQRLFLKADKVYYIKNFIVLAGNVIANAFVCTEFSHDLVTNMLLLLPQFWRIRVTERCIQFRNNKITCILVMVTSGIKTYFCKKENIGYAKAIFLDLGIKILDN